MTQHQPHNPFLVVGYFSPRYFCDRELESNKIISALNNGRNITLISPRRYGKTGLIHHVFHQLSLEQKDIVCIYFDIFATQNLSDFVQIFAQSILGQIDTNMDKVMRKFATFFKSFRPVLSYNSLSGQPEISVKIEPEVASNSLQEIFDYLKQSQKTCYIAIDEFQQIAEYPEKGTEALLRSYIQFLPNVRFVFSGSRQHLMSEMFLSAKRPFYQSTQILLLDAIDKDVYYEFAQHHFQENGTILSKACFDDIYERFEGHTWYVQVILNRLYEYRKDIDSLDIIAQTILELIAENAYSYQELLNAYSTVQVNLLTAIAKEKIVAQINASEFILKYRLKNPSSVNRALQRLLDNELVYKTDQGYIVYDRLLSLWLGS